MLCLTEMAVGLRGRPGVSAAPRVRSASRCARGPATTPRPGTEGGCVSDKPGNRGEGRMQYNRPSISSRLDACHYGSALLTHTWFYGCWWFYVVCYVTMLFSNGFEFPCCVFVVGIMLFYFYGAYIVYDGLYSFYEFSFICQLAPAVWTALRMFCGRSLRCMHISDVLWPKIETLH